MYKKIVNLENLSKALNWGHKALSLDETINQLNYSSQTFNLICEKLSPEEKNQLAVFTKNIDSLFLDNFISKIHEKLKMEAKELNKNLVCLLNQTKTLYIINTIIALKYLEMLQQLKNNQEQLTLAYMSNKMDPTRIMLNKVIEKDIYQIKEFDGIFVSKKTGTLVEVKHTLSKYAFKQIFGYTIKKKNKNKHSHLDILLDTQLCYDNGIPGIENIVVVFNNFPSSGFSDKEFLGQKLKSLPCNSIISFTTAEFISIAHEFFGQKDTRIKVQKDLKKSNIKNIFFYRMSNPDYKLIFQENNHVLCHTLIDNLENFVKDEKNNR